MGFTKVDCSLQFLASGMEYPPAPGMCLTGNVPLRNVPRQPAILPALPCCRTWLVQAYWTLQWRLKPTTWQLPCPALPFFEISVPVAEVGMHTCRLRVSGSLLVNAACMTRPPPVPARLVPCCGLSVLQAQRLVASYSQALGMPAPPSDLLEQAAAVSGGNITFLAVSENAYT